jgi:ubiquitin-protein ligase
MKEDPVEGVFVELVNDNLFEWKTYIEGPKDTP